MDDALLFQEPLAIAQLILLILVLGTLSLLAIRYLLSQPRKRPYRNVLLAALICRLPLDVLVVWVQFMQEDDLPSPFQFLGLLYIRCTSSFCMLPDVTVRRCHAKKAARTSIWGSSSGSLWGCWRCWG